jgi:signal transduction histidine kinase
VYDVDCGCEFKQPVLVHDHLVATHLYRIAQEAINNAIRHGQAKKIRVSLEANQEHLTLTVRDNGRGLPVKPRKKAGMGLPLMNYRARTIGAAMNFRSVRSGGTVVSCRLRRPTNKGRLRS